MTSKGAFEIKFEQEMEKMKQFESELLQIRQSNKDYNELFLQRKQEKEVSLNELDDLDHSISQYRKEITIKKTPIDKEMCEKNIIIENQEDDLTVITSRLRENQIIIESLKSGKTTLQQEILIHIRVITRLKVQLQELLQKWTYCRTHHKEKEIATQKERVKLLQEKIADTNNKNFNLQEAISRIQNDNGRVLDLKEKIMKKSEQIGDASKDNQNLKQQLQEARAQLKERENLTNELQKQLKQKNDIVREIGQKITSLRVKAKDMEHENEMKDKEIRDSKEQIEAATQKVSEIQVQILKTPMSRQSESFSFELSDDEGDEEVPTDPAELKIYGLHRNVKNAVKSILALRSKFAEIRRYDQIPKDDLLKILTCGLYLTDHINEEEFDLEITDINQWNYLKNFYGYSIVVDFSRFDIEEHLTDYDIPIIENVRKAIQDMNLDSINQADRCAGALLEWMRAMIVLYDATVDQMKNQQE